MVTVLLHVQPALTLFAIHLNKCDGFNAVFYDSIWEIYLSATIVYCIWCSVWFPGMFYFLRADWTSNNYVNTYTYALYSKGAIGTFVKSQGE